MDNPQISSTHVLTPEEGQGPVAASVSMHLEGAHVSGNARLTNVKGDYVTNTVNNYGEKSIDFHLTALREFVLLDAQFDSSVQDPDRLCHPGTRENVLKRLRDWIDNPNSDDRIFWLYGPAGAGKSAIAQTIAHSYTRPKVAATFFFFRSDPNRNDGKKLFTTLAYQLAYAIPAIRYHIACPLSERPDLPKTGVETQFKQLLARPFHVLNDDGIEQLSPVIIIDGVDECVNENLQRHFLKVIGDTIEGDRKFPLRFLIVSRPEVHIEQAIRRFRTPVVTINLADLDDANRDIEKYLVDEFSRIASEQRLDPTWPGKNVINNIVYKSSGNFIFASLVIRFIDDPYCFAKAQLDIVMNIQMPKTMTPFAVLDQLFLEILRRVPDQDFLKRYLVLLLARISVSGEYGELSKDDAVLMHVSEQELHANLLRMRSILKFEGGIDVHHKSFFDFLHDPSRSSEYYIPNQDGIKGYLEAFVDSLVRYVSTTIEQEPPRHGAAHFAPLFGGTLKHYPPTIQLPGVTWNEIMQPLVELHDKLLQQPDSSPAWDLLRCNKCTTFHLLRELLHLRIHLGFDSNAAPTVGKVFVGRLRNLERTVPPIAIKIKKHPNSNDLDAILLFLLARLPETMSNWTPNRAVINLMRVILRFDRAETATKVYSVLDAQKLVDLLHYMIHAKYTLPTDERRKASMLAFKIYERVPIIPQSYFLHRYSWASYPQTLPEKRIDSEIFSQTIFASTMMDRCYVSLLFKGLQQHSISFMVELYDKGSPLYRWQRRLSSSPMSTIQAMLCLARAIQHLHSMGAVLDNRLDMFDVFLDSGCRSEIRHLCSMSQSVLNEESNERFSPKENVLSFGCIFYQMYSDIDPRQVSRSKWSNRRHVVLKRPSEPLIPEYAWQLMQRCCADDPNSRPSMDEVVQEMESWKRQGGFFFRALYFIFGNLGRYKRDLLS